MEQRSVFPQTTRPQGNRITSRFRWMHHFFTADVSSENYPIIELQQRAVWIGLAFVLQALNEISYDWYMPYIKPFGTLIPLVLFVGSFIAMYMAFRSVTLKRRTKHAQGHPRRWQRMFLVLTLLLTIAGGIEAGRGVVMSFLPPQFTNDGTSLDTNAALLLLQGRNPYTDSNMLDLARHFPIQPNWTTPLQRGQFANSIDYPTMVEFQTVLDTDLKAGIAPEFESKVSYPSLSFLTLLPFALFHDYNVLPFYMLSYLLLITIAWKVVRPEMRIWLVLLTIANVPMWVSAVGGNLDIFCTLLIVMAWLLRDKRWGSAVFFGLALASKQAAWFFLPFYIIMVLRHYSFKEAVYRFTIVGGIGLAFNLPFILWNFQAWITGILAPIADPMFPLGVGIVNLSVMHMLPFLPKWVYTVLESGAMIASLAWYWQICKKHPEAAMLLAVLPLFFAWRSLSSYFYCAAYPLFILMAAKAPAHKQIQPQATSSRAERISMNMNRDEAMLRGIPASVGQGDYKGLPVPQTRLHYYTQHTPHPHNA